MKKLTIYTLAACIMLAWACNGPNAEGKRKEVQDEQAVMMLNETVLSDKGEPINATVTELGNANAFAPSTLPPEDPSTKFAAPVIKQKLIKDGKLAIKTPALNEAKMYLDKLVKKYGGYYQQEELNNLDNKTAFSLKVRIPANAFDVMVQSLENGNGEITSKEISTRDVTEEFVDLQLRLDNKKRYLKRYQEILSRAANVKDLMAVQENIRTLEEEMESAQGRLRYLNDQVLYSSLDVYLFTEKPYVHKPVKEVQFWEKLKTAFSNGWGNIVGSLLFFARIWPLCLLAVLFWWLVKKFGKKRNKPAA